MARKFLTGIDNMSQKITALAEGTNPTDAVNKAQLDAMARNQDWKASCRAASTVNLTLSGTQTVDGVALLAGERILVKDQTTASANGIYVVNSGAWSRAVDADEGAEITASMMIPVESGTANGDKVFYLVTDGVITLGSTALAFSVLTGSGASYTASNGLNLSGGAFSVVPGAGIIADGASTRIDPAYTGLAKRYSIDVPSGSTTPAITHNLATLDVTVAVREISTNQLVECDVTYTSANVVTLGFAIAPTTGQFRVIVTA